MKRCSECEREGVWALTRGMCPACYQRLRRRGLPDLPRSANGIDYEALAERYWTLRASGYHELTMAQMAEKLGTYERAIYRALKMHRYDFVEDNYDYA